MTYSPVVAPRQVELLVSPLSGTIGATIDGLSLPDDHDAEDGGPGPVARPTRVTGVGVGQ